MTAEFENYFESENSEEIMLERGKFTANGYTFTVKPIYLGEEDEYKEDVKFALYPRTNEKKEYTDKELNQYAILLFSKNNGFSVSTAPTGLFGKLKLCLVKTFCKNYQYYSDNPAIVGVIKWIEKKVYYKNKRIKFYQLERKYGLSKAEIIKLFGYFEYLSGFR